VMYARPEPRAFSVLKRIVFHKPKYEKSRMGKAQRAHQVVVFIGVIYFGCALLCLSCGLGFLFRCWMLELIPEFLLVLVVWLSGFGVLLDVMWKDLTLSFWVLEIKLK
jgi:hypothetical protein